MLIPHLALGGLSSGSRRPLDLGKRRVDARNDRRPGSVPQPRVAQETKARADRRTATRWLDHLRSCAPCHALTGIVRRPSALMDALMARVPACPYGSPWPESRHAGRQGHVVEGIPMAPACGVPRPASSPVSHACVSLTLTWP